MRAAQLLMPPYSWSADEQDSGEERPPLLAVDNGDDGRDPDMGAAAALTFTRATMLAADAKPRGP